MASDKKRRAGGAEEMSHFVTPSGVGQQGSENRGRPQAALCESAKWR